MRLEGQSGRYLAQPDGRLVHGVSFSGAGWG